MIVQLQSSCRILIKLVLGKILDDQSQGQGPECLYATRRECAKYFPNGSFQGNFDVQEVLDSAMGFLMTQSVTFFSDSLEVLQFLSLPQHAVADEVPAGCLRVGNARS